MNFNRSMDALRYCVVSVYLQSDKKHSTEITIAASMIFLAWYYEELSGSA